MAGNNSIVTEYFLAQNFSPKSGITPGSDNVRAMDCDQIKARYDVDIAGVSSTGLRCPGQNQLTAISTTVVAIDTYSEASYLDSPTTTMSITLPATVQSGKLIVFWVLLNTDATISSPSGFTVFAHMGGGNYKSYAIGYKMATGSEGGTSISCTIGSSSYGEIGYAILSGVKQTAPYVVTADSYKSQYGTEINFDYAGTGYNGAMNIIISNTNLVSSGTVSQTAGWSGIGGYSRGNTNYPIVNTKLQSGNVWDNFTRTSTVNGYHNGIRIQIIPQ